MNHAVIHTASITASRDGQRLKRGRASLNQTIGITNRKTAVMKSDGPP